MLPAMDNTDWYIPLIAALSGQQPSGKQLHVLHHSRGTLPSCMSLPTLRMLLERANEVQIVMFLNWHACGMRQWRRMAACMAVCQ